MSGGIFLRVTIGFALCLTLSAAHDDSQSQNQKRNIFNFIQNQELFDFEHSEVAKTFEQISNYELDNLQADLGRNTNVSKTCLDHTMMILDGVRAGEFWALEMLDAVGKPPSAILRGNFKWLGSFSQCTNITAWVNVSGKAENPFTGKHCIATIAKGHGDGLQQSPSGAEVPAAFGKITPSIAVCVPSSCNNIDVAGLVNSGLFALPENYTVVDVTCTNTNIPLDWRAILAIVIFSIVGCLVICGTAFDAIMYTMEQNNTEKGVTLNSVIEDKRPNGVDNQHNVNEYTPLVANNKPVNSPPSQHGIALRMLLCFSVYTNGDKILKVGPPSESSLDCVHGIRFFSMTWVMLCHTFAFGIGVTGNPALATDYLKRYSFQVIINGFFSVDAFFFLSGLLVSYLVLRELKAKNGKLNWIMYYFHRFWRLTPPYMLILMFSACLSRYVSTGPLWPEQGFERNYCNDTWWTNLLYINNFVKDDKMCMGWSWYLANDMQFHWISPILIIAFFKSAIAGYIVTGAMLLGHLIVTGLLSAEYGDNYTAVIDPAKAGNTLQGLYIYIKPYTRIGPYLVGFVVGYILYRTNRKVKLHWAVALLGWLIAATLSLLTQYGLWGEFNGHPLSDNVMALYDATSRTVWSIGLGWVVFACCTGYGGFVNTILSWPGLIPLSRLTYCCYLVHPIVIYTILMSRETTLIMSDIGLVQMFFGFFMSTYGVAFIASMCLEAPFMRLEKVIFKR